mmetsp:Transcript_9381/g.14926  ORF Transcript_9381/g.14926 Transcript_9381/m.14926 type:complete len:333 (-) Transcript_9381:290-1288(-)
MSVLSASSAIHVAASAPTAGSKPRCMTSAARGLSARAGSKFFGAGATANAAASLRVAPRGRAADGSAPPRSRGAGLVVQANLFNRLGRVIGSYANSLVSSAEDPEKILEQTVIEMGEDLVKMRQASAQVIASQKQLENKYKQAQATSDDWYRRAELAMSKGDEELAKEALTRRKSYQENADSMLVNLEGQKAAVEKLIANTRFLETKMTEAKSKKDTLKARSISAKTNKQVQDLVSGVSTSSALSAFEKMEEKVMSMEAETDAIGMLNAGTNELEDKFKALEGGDIDDELAKMKAGMLGDGGKKGGALPAGRPVSDAIESELEALRKKADNM